MLTPQWQSTLAAAAILAAVCLAAGGCRKTAKTPAAPAVTTITSATGIEMALLPAGEFTMGSDRDDEDERPAHSVRVGAFYMDTHEVTQRDFESLTGADPSRFKGLDRPVECVGWLAVIKYCNLRSRKEGLRPCYDLATGMCDFAADGYRLPTEAEWEYACRAGTDAEFPFAGADTYKYQSPAALADYAWFAANAGQATHPVGQKRPNAWGLCDMLGNVAEWCNDFYRPREYASGGADNPRGPAAGDYRVVRGGSWRSAAARCRPAARQGESPGAADACLGYEVYGFRCVRARLGARD